MKTLIFNGSPRKNGDTVHLIRLLTENLEGEYRIVDAYHCSISPCVDCRWCKKNSSCAINDEMQEIYDYIRECDNIVIASPLYFSELTGKLLDVASRLQMFFCARFFRRETLILKEKKGAIILAGGGAGGPDKAISTAAMILKQLRARDVHAPVCSLDTDRKPASDDMQAREGILSIARFFNGN